MVLSDDLAPLTGVAMAGPPAGHVPGLARTGRLVAEHLRLLGARPSDRPAPAQPADGLRFDLRGSGFDLAAGVTGWAGLGAGPFDESVAQAACGLMAVHGRASGGPRRLGVDYVSTMAGVLAVQGVLAGALGLARGVPVRRTELAAARAAVFSLVQYVAHATADEEPDVLDPAELTDRHRPPFVSSDGVSFELESLDPDAWREFWLTLGAPAEAVARSWWPFMMRYGRATTVLPAELFDTTAKTGYAGIQELVARCGMSVCRIRSLAERRADPGLWPATGTAAPWRLSPWDEQRASPWAPAPGDDPALPLAGIRIVESTRRMQGPLAGRLLQLLGADVTRIEPPGGDPMRGMAPLADGCAAGFRSANQDKRVVEIDFKTPSGRDEVLDLVRDADVFLHNWAPGKAGPLRLDAPDLLRANPGLVYAWASGWGDALGPNPPLGTDFQVQAHSGIAERMTAAEEAGPRPSLMIITDVLGAAVAAEGVLAGLLRSHRTGRGTRVESSLFSAATTMLSDELRSGPAARTGIDDVFRTADGLLAVAARTPEQVRRVNAVLGLGDFTARPGHEWERELHALDVAAAVVHEDVATLPAKDGFASMFGYHGCSVVTAPWSFR